MGSTGKLVGAVAVVLAAAYAVSGQRWSDEGRLQRRLKRR